MTKPDTYMGNLKYCTLRNKMRAERKKQLSCLITRKGFAESGHLELGLAGWVGIFRWTKAVKGIPHKGNALFGRTVVENSGLGVRNSVR